MIGVLAAVGGDFRPAHEALFAQLLEPFASALRNDQQVHELVRLREALEADNQALLSRLGRQEIADAIVGAEAGLRTVMDRVAQVAATDVPVLLLGETGTGKEVIAREIHRRSARAQRSRGAGELRRHPARADRLGAVRPRARQLHRRGERPRAGWFERADGGTLFLDEIGELPPDAQVRLLRVLQDGTFERVGGHRTHTVDVRIVAATHRDLHTMVQAARLSRGPVVPHQRLSDPPAARCASAASDIPALAAHFAWRAGQRLGGAPLVPGPEDHGAAAGLSLARQRARAGGGDRARRDPGRRAPAGGRRGARRRPVAAPAAVTGARRPPRARPPAAIATLDEAMAEHIERALAATRGRIEGPTGAAALLGINPHTLRARMRKLGVEWARFRG